MENFELAFTYLLTYLLTDRGFLGCLEILSDIIKRSVEKYWKLLRIAEKCKKVFLAASSSCHQCSGLKPPQTPSCTGGTLNCDALHCTVLQSTAMYCSAVQRSAAQACSNVVYCDVMHCGVL